MIEDGVRDEKLCIRSTSTGRKVHRNDTKRWMRDRNIYKEKFVQT